MYVTAGSSLAKSLTEEHFVVWLLHTLKQGTHGTSFLGLPTYHSLQCSQWSPYNKGKQQSVKNRQISNNSQSRTGINQTTFISIVILIVWI